MASTGVQATVDQINAETLQFAPAIIAGILAAKNVTAPGADKHAAVINAIQAGSEGLAGLSIDHPKIASISATINLFVTIFKALGQL